MKKDKENLFVKRFYLARAIARISLLVPPRHSLLQNRGKITPFRPFYLEKCQKNDRKLIEKGRTKSPLFYLFSARRFLFLLRFLL